MTSSVPLSAGQLTQSVVEARLGEHDADVRQRRLGENARHVARAASACFERADVVPLDDARRHGTARPACRRCRGARADLAALEDGERLVDGAVVAPVEDEDLAAGR